MRTIFVFGSNREGRHGKGAALIARKRWGAVYGQHEGLQGDSYAIVTKELRPDVFPVTLQEISIGVNTFKLFAAEHRNWTFILTPIGCGLAGFKPEQIKPLFEGATNNVIMPDEFR